MMLEHAIGPCRSRQSDLRFRAARPSQSRGANSRPARRAMLCALAASLLSGPALAQKPSSILVKDAWLRPTPAGMAMTGGYLVITNASAKPIHLRSASTAAAATVTLHRSVISAGIARMEQPPGGFVIPAGASIAFQPGGNHLMLEGLKRPLKVGDKLKISLAFDGFGAVPVSFEVRATPSSTSQPSPSSMSSMPGMKMR